MSRRNRAETAFTAAVLDDDLRIGATIATYLEKMGCSTLTYDDPQKCLAEMEVSPIDILITDLRMPAMDGITVLKTVRQKTPSTDVIIVTGSADKKDAIAALKLGAFDFFEKPIDGEELVQTVKKTVRYRQVLKERNSLAEQVSFLSQREAERWGIKGFMGKSPAVKRIVNQVHSLQTVPGTGVLITGESGTGKELIARTIHFGSPRSRAAFVPVNCSAVPGELAESILFGHSRGAFTGATSDKKGCFELADGGTLFLDEIGDMPRFMQAKLLRVLDDGVVCRVGAAAGRHMDVRVIAATNADLESSVARGSFRSDLYYRLAKYTICVPALRDRKEDVPPLARHFLQALASEMGLSPEPLSREIMESLREYTFPGNVRELKNMIERALIESGGKKIGVEHLCFSRMAAAPETDSHEYAPEPETHAGRGGLNLQAAEAALIRKAMAASGGNVAATARLLGINRSKLYRKITSLEAAAK